MLRRLEVRYKRGRRHVHPPDPEYGPKMTAVRAARAEAEAAPGRAVSPYEDGLTYYRRPTVARGYAAAGADGPRAEQGHGSDTKRRVIGAFEPRTARLIAWQRSCADRSAPIGSYRAVRAAYPAAEVVCIAQDNGSVHFHPEVPAALEGTGVRRRRRPTYAPWTDPAEEVWRKLCEDVLHLHGYADRREDLKAAVAAWLARGAGGSEELKRSVGCSRINL